jgi:hypothetical protein
MPAWPTVPRAAVAAVPNELLRLEEPKALLEPNALEPNALEPNVLEPNVLEEPSELEPVLEPKLLGNAFVVSDCA